MLGDLIWEAKGKMTGIRVLGSDAQGTKMEQSWAGTGQGKGALAGVDGNETGTAISVWRPDGIVEAEGQLLTMTIQGDAVVVKAKGLTLPTGPTRLSGRGMVTFWSASPKLSWLNKTVGIYEVEIDQATQEYTTRVWQWK